jgi:CubicO group peptidase (beta-lactamase class C family)
MCKHLLLLVFAVVATARSSIALGVDTDAIDALFAEYDHPGSPGCAIGVIVEGELVYARGYGAANLEHRVPNGIHTLFEIGSSSKAFTSLCVALLLDEGLIQPDDCIREYLPDMPECFEPIRIRHLMQCRAGIWDAYHLMPLVGRENLPIASPFIKEDLLTLIRQQPTLPIEPGSEFRYGSTEYLLVGEIIEKVTGQSLPEFAAERVFGPLGMSHTFYETDPSLIVPNRADCYYEDAQGVRRQWRNHGYFSGGSGVLTSVADLATFERCFLEEVFPTGEYVDHFLATGVLLDNRNCLDALPKDTYRGLRRFQFTGGVFGAASAILRFPDERTTFICLANDERISPWIECERMADIVLAGRLEPVAPELTAALEALASETAIELTEEQLASYMGEYRIAGGHLTWRFEQVDGRLVLVDHVHRRHVLEAVGPARFRPVPPTPFDETARLIFHRDESTSEWVLSESRYVSENLRSTEFRPTTLATPTVEELQSLAGVYDCEPLAVSYRFRVEQGALQVRVGSGRWEQLDPLLDDEFIPHERTAHDQRLFRFQRDESGQVSGMVVSFWRIRELPFVRRGARTEILE